jgi:hypothetical protein
MIELGHKAIDQRLECRDSRFGAVERHGMGDEIPDGQLASIDVGGEGEIDLCTLCKPLGATEVGLTFVNKFANSSAQKYL